MKTIYNVYVPIESQEQADRMKQICIDYGLPYWKNTIAFRYDKGYEATFECFELEFGVWNGYPKNKTQVTESEFLELLKMLNKC